MVGPFSHYPVFFYKVSSSIWDASCTSLHVLLFSILSVSSFSILWTNILGAQPNRSSFFFPFASFPVEFQDVCPFALLVLPAHANCFDPCSLGTIRSLIPPTPVTPQRQNQKFRTNNDGSVSRFSSAMTGSSCRVVLRFFFCII